MDNSRNQRDFYVNFDGRIIDLNDYICDPIVSNFVKDIDKIKRNKDYNFSDLEKEAA